MDISIFILKTCVKLRNQITQCGFTENMESALTKCMHENTYDNGFKMKVKRIGTW